MLAFRVGHGLVAGMPRHLHDPDVKFPAAGIPPAGFDFPLLRANDLKRGSSIVPERFSFRRTMESNHSRVLGISGKYSWTYTCLLSLEEYILAREVYYYAAKIFVY